MKLKRMIVGILIIFGIFMISGCNKKEDNSDALKFKEEYEEYNGKESSSGKILPDVTIDEDNKMVYSSLEEVNKIIKNGSGVIYFGYPNCPWCRNAIPVLIKAASGTSLDKIYYVNMYEERDKYKINDDGSIEKEEDASSEYYEVLELLDSILSDYTLEDNNGNEVSVGEKRIYVPLVVFVKDGKIIGSHADTVESQTDPYVTLDEEQTLELYNIYSNLIHEYLGDVCEEEEHC